MTRLRIRTPSRLHFGLLGWGPESPRQFGGVGLMIDAPGLEFTAEPSPSWHAEGPLAARTLDVARRVADRLARRGLAASPARFEMLHAPPEHAGLGVGTQLSLAVTRVLTAMAGVETISIADLADLSERGLRSGIGLHGFVHGGLIVDGGRRQSGGIPPLLVRQDFPPDWGILVVIPGPFQGLHGPAEIRGIRPASSHAQVIDRPALPSGPARALAGGRRTRPDLIRQGRLRASRSTSATISRRPRAVPMPDPPSSPSSVTWRTRGSAASGKVPGGPQFTPSPMNPIERRVALLSGSVGSSASMPMRPSGHRHALKEPPSPASRSSARRENVRPHLHRIVEWMV